MSGTVLMKLCVCTFLVATSAMNGSYGQHRRTYPTPPSPAVPDGPAVPEVRTSRRLDIVAMEREAKEMSVLAASISADIEELKKGLLPSGAVDKLKRIEKLSNQLRGQIRP